jgi:biopolymer transport protein ExbB
MRRPTFDPPFASRRRRHGALAPHRSAALALVLVLLAFVWPRSALAWWNEAWPQRVRVAIDTGPAGLALAEPIASVPVAVRLHSGNFDFTRAKPDGSDLRVLAGDDRTPLPFRVERFDAANELGLVWVLMPAVAPGTAAGGAGGAGAAPNAPAPNTLFVYAGNTAAAAEAAAGTGFDAATLAALRFASAEAPDALGALRAAAAPALAPASLLGAGLAATGAPVVFTAAGPLAAAAGAAPFTASGWVRSEAPAGTLWQWGARSVALASGRVVARVGRTVLEGGSVPAGQWAHVALVVGAARAALYVDGAAVAQADLAPAAAPAGANATNAATTANATPELRLAESFTGMLDEWQFAAAERSAAWVAFAAATQGVGAKGIVALREEEGEAEGASAGGGYLGILVANLTVDAWVVILICALMLVVALWVMVDKSVFIARADHANRGFLARFREARSNLLDLGGEAAAKAHANSSLFRLYAAGVRELHKRDIGNGHVRSQPLSGASLDAVKAAVDADMVRETHRLNSKMVLLTIAISGGPFLGLLGTVVGVMITFAAIAAAGDVNVNAIAPGIAAALLATVAGLAVAIPALFGYNYLATRIKAIAADMQIFVDEFITRVAEEHGAR